MLLFRFKTRGVVRIVGRYIHVIHVFAVVHQDYRTEADNEFVILGNSAVIKCEIPSFVADFVTVEGWIEENTSANFLASNAFGT